MEGHGSGEVGADEDDEVEEAEHRVSWGLSYPLVDCAFILGE